MAKATTKIQFSAYVVQAWISMLKDPTKNDTALRMEGVQIKQEYDAQMAKADREANQST